MAASTSKPLRSNTFPLRSCNRSVCAPFFSSSECSCPDPEVLSFCAYKRNLGSMGTELLFNTSLCFATSLSVCLKILWIQCAEWIPATQNIMEKEQDLPFSQSLTVRHCPYRYHSALFPLYPYCQK